jgi:hypothetical protein
MPASTNSHPAAAADAREWRPQTAGPGDDIEFADAIVEPHWSGRRVIAHFLVQRSPDGNDDVSVTLLDEAGADVSAQVRNAVEALSRGVMALDAVIDGVLTSQLLDSRAGPGSGVEAELPNWHTFVPQVGIRRHLPGGQSTEPTLATVPEVPEMPEMPPAGTSFVALDLLRVDGQTLLDLPLLERRRHLESLLVISRWLRITPYARPPLRPWFNSWRSAGFDGVVLKSANSRYRPGTATSDWAVVKRMPHR